MKKILSLLTCVFLLGSGVTSLTAEEPTVNQDDGTTFVQGTDVPKETNVDNLLDTNSDENTSEEQSLDSDLMREELDKNIDNDTCEDDSKNESDEESEIVDATVIQPQSDIDEVEVQDNDPLIEPMSLFNATEVSPRVGSACSAESVACIGDVGYVNMNTAIINAKDGDTVVLQKDIRITDPTFDTNISISGYPMNPFDLTIDLNNHVIESTTNDLIKITGANLNLTIKNGYLKGLGEDTYGVYVYSNGGYSVTTNLDNLNIDTTSQAIGVNGLNQNQVLNVSNCEIKTNGLGIYFPPISGTLTVNDSSIDAHTGIWVKGGNTILNNATVRAHGDAFLPDKPYTGGQESVTLTGNAIYMEGGYDRAISLDINGGTYTSDKGMAVQKLFEEESVGYTLDISPNSGNFGDPFVLNYAEAGDDIDITLVRDVAIDAVVPKEVTVDLDLNGKVMTNVNSHTIDNYGTLTITGDGTVDNFTHGKGALVTESNAATVVDSGNFTRSKEAGKSPNNSGGNSWYVVRNLGTTTFNGGNVYADGDFSSLVDNYKTMYINGGSFKNGFNVIKNEEASNLTITGGTFTTTNSNRQSLQTYGTTEITGGEFNGNLGVLNYDIYDSSTSIIDAKINGDLVVWDDNSSSGDLNLSVGGITSVTGEIYKTFDGVTPNDEADGSISISSGIYDSDTAVSYIVDGLTGIAFKSDGDIKYYVGSNEDIADQLKIASNGDSVIVLKGDLDLSNVPGGVTITNQSDGNVTVDNEKLESGESLVTPELVISNSRDNASSTNLATWDDGGPFTTDSCGSVFDRWGNLIWQGTCPVNGQSTGFQLVNTADR